MFQIYSTVDSIKTLKNGGLKITLETQDITTFSAEELAEIFKLNDKYVWTAIKEAPIKPDELDIKEPPLEFKNDKSPSQRLRNALWVYWNESKPTNDFDSYYKQQMEKIINLVKDKLN
jgi:hypothetical protein